MFIVINWTGDSLMIKYSWESIAWILQSHDCLMSASAFLSYLIPCFFCSRRGYEGQNQLLDGLRGRHNAGEGWNLPFHYHFSRFILALVRDNQVSFTPWATCNIYITYPPITAHLLYMRGESVGKSCPVDVSEQEIGVHPDRVSPTTCLGPGLSYQTLFLSNSPCCFVSPCLV